MKSLFTLLLFCPILLFAHSQFENSSSLDSISIHVMLKNGGAGMPINISTPIHGSFMIGRLEKTQTDEEGEVFVKLPLNKSGFCQVWLNHLPWVGRTNCIQLFVVPGGEYGVTLEKDHEFEDPDFDGDHEVENAFLNSFNRYTVDYSGKSEYLKLLMYNRNGAAFLNYLQKLEQQDHKKLNEFKKNHKSDEEFLVLLQNDIKYYYTQLFFIGWNVNNQLASQNEDTTGIGQWNQSLQKLFAQTKIEDPTALGSFWYNSYKSVSWYWYFDEVMPRLDTVKKENVDMRKYELISEYFSGEVREQHLAYTIKHKALKNRFSKSVQALFLRFRSEYPLSPYLPDLSAEFEELLDFQDSQQSKTEVFEKDVISDLNDLKSKYSDQLLYIDIWASWCGPCKMEFEGDNSMVYSFCEQNNIQLIYISIDKPSKKEQCSKIIGFYDLKGDHILANNSLVNSLENELNNGNGYPIPRYLIIDKNGDIVVKSALRPSSKQALIDQLKQYLN